MNKDVEKILLKVQKPGRYTGGELNSVMKDKQFVDLRFAFCFPDIYEVGMSHLGMKILYSVLNRLDGVWCERVFAPWTDMEAQMKEHGVPLFALESGDPLGQFDMIGFTLQYELSFTNVLNMLNLSHLALRSCERSDSDPLIIAGGPCVCNPEPLAPFIDLFCLGEGEEVICEVVELYRKFRSIRKPKSEFLKAAARIHGVYVPSLYRVTYRGDGTIEKISPSCPEVPAIVQKRIIRDLSKVYYPENFVVPFLDIVHDRAILEIFRGCIRGCRFCQAGYIYRPVREKPSEVLNRQGRALCESTGYDEISLSSLSTSDYSGLQELLPKMLEWTKENGVSLSLPSLRIDNFPQKLMEEIQSVRKSSLTFAPEAGTQRLRDSINKNITEEDILKTCKMAFEGGWTNVKLYFMLGLPGETMEDIEGIARLSQKIVDEFYAMPGKPKGKSVHVSVSVAVFVPKPFTPFQWEPQDSRETIVEKQKYLISCNKSRKISISYHGNKTSFLEAVFARGDRKLADVLETAYKKGCRLDSWDEFFDFGKWMQAFEENGLEAAFYANRKRSFDEILPWSHLDYGVSTEFLKSEDRKAAENITTENCREKCAGCGANKLMGGACFDSGKN